MISVCPRRGMVVEFEVKRKVRYRNLSQTITSTIFLLRAIPGRLQRPRVSIGQGLTGHTGPKWLGKYHRGDCSNKKRVQYNNCSVVSCRNNN